MTPINTENGHILASLTQLRSKVKLGSSGSARLNSFTESSGGGGGHSGGGGGGGGGGDRGGGGGGGKGIEEVMDSHSAVVLQMEAV